MVSHAILLQEVTPKHVTLFRKGISRLLSCLVVWQSLSTPNMFRRLRREFSAVGPRCSFQITQRSRIWSLK
jgi:hypothetical protein